VVRDDKGEPVEIVGSWTDVTERKEAEAARRAARERLNVLLGVAPVVIYSFEVGGAYAPTFVSPNIERLLGYKPEEYLEGADFWREHVHPDDLPRVEGQQSEVFEKGVNLVEYRFQDKHGTYRWLIDEQQLVRDETGRPVEVVGSLSNIDQRKAAERALQASQAELAKATEAAVEASVAKSTLREAFVQDSAVPEAPSGNPRDVVEPLVRLKQLLENDDGEAADFIIDVTPQLSCVLTQGEVSALSDHVSQFDFEAALQALSGVAARLSLDLEAKGR
jgi:PAS domain S-box-containing protein